MRNINHTATIYETPKGNFVFDAPTCWWNMPLSAPPLYREKLNPDGAYHGLLVDFRESDSRVQKMTENLFNKVIHK